jgi:hypothetical protein
MPELGPLDGQADVHPDPLRIFAEARQPLGPYDVKLNVRHH